MNPRSNFASGNAIPAWCVWIIIGIIVFNLILSFF